MVKSLNQKLGLMLLVGTLGAPAAFANGGYATIVYNVANSSAASYHGASSRYDAEQGALNICGAGCYSIDPTALESGTYPTVHETWSENGWVALASDNAGHWGAAGIHDTQANAENDALRRCGNSACFVVRSLSSYAAYEDQEGTNNFSFLRH